MPRRTRQPVETADYLAMAGRIVRALGRRVGDGDPDDLAGMLALRDQLDDAIAEAVRANRETHGRSWADIASGAGITRQAAHQRWGR